MIINNINNRKYFGRTKRVKDRKATHLNLLRQGKHHSSKMQEDFDEFGEKAFEFVVLMEDVIEPEIEELKLIESNSDGYNMIKQSKGITNYIHHGEDNGMYGKKHSKESKERMRQSKEGMYDGEDNPFYGKIHSEETKEKISMANKGNGKDIPKSDEHREKIKMSNPLRKVIFIDNIRYNSINEASRILGIDRKTITYRLNSKNFKNYNYDK